MADCKSKSLVVEVVAGSGTGGTCDDLLHECEFHSPMALCAFGASLVIVEGNGLIRGVDGGLGVDTPMAFSCELSEFEADVVPLIMTAIAQVPKELARLMAQHAHSPARSCTIAGSLRVKDKSVDGPALDGAQFSLPSAVAVDATDPVAGPQLLIGQLKGALRCLNMRTRMVTTIAGAFPDADGPALRADLGQIRSIVVAPNGAVCVSYPLSCVVRRVSAAKWPASGDPPAERMVTTLIGAPGPGVQLTRPSVAAFHQSLNAPWAMALHCPPPDAKTAAVSDPDADGDVGRLYAGCADGVHAFDLAAGECKVFRMAAEHAILTGLALTEDGTRLYAVTGLALYHVSTQTGAMRKLFRWSADETLRDCVLDTATRSVVLCDFDRHTIVRVGTVPV